MPLAVVLDVANIHDSAAFEVMSMPYLAPKPIGLSTREVPADRKSVFAQVRTSQKRVESIASELPLLPLLRNSDSPYKFSKDLLPFSVFCRYPCTPASRSCSEPVQSARTLEATNAEMPEELERNLSAYNGSRFHSGDSVL